MAGFQVETGSLQAGASLTAADAASVDGARGSLTRAASIGDGFGNGGADSAYESAYRNAQQSLQALSDAVHRVSQGLSGAAGTYSGTEAANGCALQP